MEELKGATHSETAVSSASDTHHDQLPELIAQWIEECDAIIWGRNSAQIIDREQSTLGRFFAPFKLRSSPYVVSLTLAQTQKLIDKLLALAPRERMSDAQLYAVATTLKNRAEIFSEKSDFYPSYSALVAIFLTYAAFRASTDLKVLLYLGGFIFILTSFSIRISTRREVCKLKCLANIVENAVKVRA